MLGRQLIWPHRLWRTICTRIRAMFGQSGWWLSRWFMEGLPGRIEMTKFCINWFTKVLYKSSLASPPFLNRTKTSLEDVLPLILVSGQHLNLWRTINGPWQAILSMEWINWNLLNHPLWWKFLRSQVLWEKSGATTISTWLDKAREESLPKIDRCNFTRATLNQTIPQETWK